MSTVRSSRPGLAPQDVPEYVSNALQATRDLLDAAKSKVRSEKLQHHDNATKELCAVVKGVKDEGLLQKEITTVLLRHFPIDGQQSLSASKRAAEEERRQLHEQIERAAGDVANLRSQLKLVSRECEAAKALPNETKDLRLEDVMDVSPLRRHFTNHLNDSLSSENIEFLLALRNFRDVAEDVEDDERRAAALVVWERFLDDAAKEPVNVSGVPKKRAGEKIKGPEPVQSDVFQQMEEELVKSVMRGAVIGFTTKYKEQCDKVLKRASSDASAQLTLVVRELLKSVDRLTALLGLPEDAKKIRVALEASEAMSPR